MSEYIVAIPARYASTRLPGKPLCDVGGMPMIKRVCLQALKSKAKVIIFIIIIINSKVFYYINKKQYGLPYTKSRWQNANGFIRSNIKLL